jgi:nitrogen regulatory protein PII
MKQVLVIVKPFLAERVLEILERAPIEACTVQEVKGYARQRDYLDEYRENEYALAFLPKVEISFWIDGTRLSETVSRIAEVARTGALGDGKIFVMGAEFVAQSK